MDCDDVMLLVAVGEGRTLSGTEEARFHQHVAGCEACRTLTGETADEQLRWVARVSEDAFDDPDLLVLPMIDPIVFTKGDELAHGGMGRITRARDRRLGRDVAIKEVLAPSLRARFEREAMITAKLQHPAIVPVYEAGTWPDGSAFYTMRLVSGGTLSDAFDHAKTLEDRLALLPHVVALTEALGYAHARRIVHRDLKPANVLVGEFGETVVIDWGLAKELDHGIADDADGGDGASASPELTRAGTVVGTPCFLSPEQAAGDDIDERADVYALGAILYQLLAGSPPYWDSTEHSADRLVAAALTTPPTPIARLAPRAPADLRAIIEHAMAREPAARYPTAKEMADELRRFQTGQLLGSRVYSTRERLARWIRRHRTAVAVGAVAAGVLAIVLGLSAQQIVTRQRETRRLLAESQLERGRQLIVDGDPAKAIPYLEAALAELPGDPVAHRLAARALRDVPRRLGSFEGNAAVFTPTSDRLAIGRSDGSVTWIDARTGRPLGALSSIGGAVVALACAPDGKRLAVVAKDGVYLRDAITGAPASVANTAEASGVRFLPDGRLAIAGKDAVLLVGLDGRVSRTPPLESPHALAVSWDGGHLGVISNDRALVWDLRAPAWNLDPLAVDPIKMAPAWGELYAITFDHEGVITAGQEGVIQWHAGQRGTQLLSWPVATLSWAADRTLLADGAVIQTDTGASHLLAHNSIQIGAVAGPGRAVTGGYDHTLRIWDLERDARPIIVLDAEAATDELRVDATGRRAISRSNTSGRVELWDVEAPRARVLELGGHVDWLLADRDRLAVQVDGNKTRLVVSARGAERVLEPVHEDGADRDTLSGWPVAFRPQHDELVTGLDGILKIYSSRDGAPVREIPGKAETTTGEAIGANKLWHVAFSRDGKQIAISSERRIWLFDEDWRLITPEPLVEEKEGSPSISALARDDDHLVTGYQNGMWKIWDAHTGALLRMNEHAHTATLNRLEIRGDTLFSASWDPTRRLWAIPGGEPRGVFKRFNDLSISPGRQQLASVDGSTVLSLWDRSQDRLLEQRPAGQGLEYVAFIDDDHVVVVGDAHRLELIDLTEPRLTPDELRRLIAARPRWQLVDGRAVERDTGRDTGRDAGPR